MPRDQRLSIHVLPLHFGWTITGSEGGQSQSDKGISRVFLRNSPQQA